MSTRTNIKSRVSIGNFIIKYAVYFIFLLVCVMFSFTSKNFLTVSNFVLIIQQCSPLIIGVIGMTFVMMDGGIDISAGSNMYLSAAVCALLVNKLNASGVVVNSVYIYVLIFATGAIVGLIIGCVNGLLIAKFKMVPFIETLIMTSITRGLGMFITDASIINLNNQGFKLSDKFYFGISILIYMTVVILAIFHVIFRYTKFGLQLKAQGNNHEAAAKMGFNVTRNTFTVYVICGALCGLCGIMLAGASGSVPTSFAVGYEFVLIPAAVLGGTSLFGGKGTVIPGAIVGMVLVYTIINGLTMMSANPYIYTIVRGFIIFVAVMLDNVNNKGETR